MNNLFRQIADTHETGLQLVTLPTGTGKTYSMRQFIVQYVIDHMDDETSRNIVMVTSLKKNLIHKDLQKEFESRGHPELYDRFCLFLDSVSGAVLDNWNHHMANSIERLFPGNEKARSFVRSIELIKKLRCTSGISKETLADLEAEFARRTEPAFRKMLRESVRENCGKTIAKRLETLRTNDDWSWIVELYPAVRTTESRVFLMSADKFVTESDTIIGKSATVYDSDITKNAIVFIDEFDSTKDRIQSAIVRRNLRREIDLIDLFNRIHEGLREMDDHPTRLYRPAESMEVSDKDSLRSMEREVLGRFDEVGKRFRLNINKKVRNTDKKRKGVFIFHGESIIPVSPNRDLVSLTFDKDENMDFIDIDSTDQRGWDMMEDMFRQMRGCIRFFSAMASKLSVNYSKQNGDPAMSYEDCIRTVLWQFGLRGDAREFMVEEVLMSSDRKKSGKSDRSFYENGFRIYSFRDEKSNNLRSSVTMTSQDSTPEKILLRVSRRGLVFGLSATAELKTVISNFDLHYLKCELKDEFLPSVADNQGLVGQIERAWSGYDRVDIEVNTCNAKIDGAYRPEIWDNVFTNATNVTFVKSHMGDLNSFVAERYYKSCKAFSDFVSSPDSTAGLAFFNKMPKKGDLNFDREVLSKLYEMIVREKNVKGFDVSEHVMFISSEGFDDRKTELLNKLSQGMRMFVVTTYGTLGAGQNIQYPCSGKGYVNISSRENDEEADFDFIYVEKPTNIVANPGAKDQEARINLIFQILCLKENGEISRGKAEKSIISTLLSNEIEIGKVRSEMLGKKSARNAAAGKVIQAVGRICRTNMKRPIIRILADGDLADVFTEPVESYGRVNVETRKIIEKFSRATKPTDDTDPMIQRSLNRSYRALSLINMTRSKWTPESISEWHRLREYVLANPTTNEDSDITYNMYADSPGLEAYWYESKDDFDKLAIHFAKPSKPCEEVSASSARLDTLMSVPVLRDLFESKGYATGFEKARYIMSPPLFKNIYKGAIGEVVGDFVLRQLNYKPAEMPAENFEMFDAVLSDGIYIDYKHWASSGFTDETEQTRHIFEKLREVDGRTAIIANVLRRERDKTSSVQSYEKEEMMIVTIPWLLDISGNKMVFNREAIEAIDKVIG